MLICPQIPETLPPAVLEKMHAPGPDTSIPEIDVHDLPNYDGFLIGFPTRWALLHLLTTGQHAAVPESASKIAAAEGYNRRQRL